MDSRRRLPLRHIVQREIGRVLSPLWTPLAVALMRFGMGYRIASHQALRAKFARIREESDAPLLLCANHLTMLDSFLVAWALSPTWRYSVFYDELPWNVPERSNFASNPWERFTSYVMKCIPITRGGAREEVAAVLERLASLTLAGEVALIFPEGGRSRSGRVDVEGAGWGIGRILSAIPDCRVACIYMRGAGQTSWSERPARGETLAVELECIEPKSDLRGVRRSRDIARQVVGKLAGMEKEYFDGRE
jgi:1-acyl-sn-glycerol-3-phosphate acyltransferase